MNRKDYCFWYFDDDLYNTECYNVHIFLDGNIDDNGFIYCPYCGCKILQKNNQEIRDE